jgi:hypothetical protein
MIQNTKISMPVPGARPLVANALSITTLHHRLGLAIRHYLGEECSISGSHMRDWASATFIGARHHFHFDVPISGRTISPEMQSRINGLADQDFDMSGHLVADISVQEAAHSGKDAIIAATHDSTRRITIYVLTVETD